MTAPAHQETDAHVSWREVLTRAHAPALLISSLGVWLHAADGLVVATMTPAIIADIGGGALIAWALALYEVGSISAGALAGLAAMRHGVRVMMAISALVFALGCIVSAAAPTMPVLLAGRLFQGLGGGCLVALAFVAVAQFFPQRLMPRVMAVISGLWGVSSFIGPLVGGFFVEYGESVGGWRGGFLLFALQAVLLSGIVLVAAPRGAGPGSEKMDGARSPWRRVALIALCVVAIASAGIDVAPIRSALFIALGVAALWLFLRLDAGAGGARMLPKGAASLRSQAGAAVCMVFFFAVATVAIAVYGPLLMIRLHGLSAFEAGYLLAIGSISWTVTAILASGQPEQRDPVWILAGAVALLGAAAGFFASVPHGPVWLIGVSAMLEGGGFGLAWTFILRRAIALSPPDDAERISGGLPTVQRLGYAVGAAGAGILANASGMSAFEAGDPAAGQAVGLAVFGASILPAFAGLFAAWRLVSLRRPSAEAADAARRPSVS